MRSLSRAAKTVNAALRVAGAVITLQNNLSDKWHVLTDAISPALVAQAKGRPISTQRIRYIPSIKLLIHQKTQSGSCVLFSDMIHAIRMFPRQLPFFAISGMFVKRHNL